MRDSRSVMNRHEKSVSEVVAQVPRCGLRRRSLSAAQSGKGVGYVGDSTAPTLWALGCPAVVTRVPAGHAQSTRTAHSTPPPDPSRPNPSRAPRAVLARRPASCLRPVVPAPRGAGRRMAGCLQSHTEQVRPVSGSGWVPVVLRGGRIGSS